MTYYLLRYSLFHDNIYMKGFEKAGMVNENSRFPYQVIPDNFSCSIDRQRSINGIDLLYTASGKFFYGTKILLKIIVYCFPALKRLCQNWNFLKIADKLYKVLFFNRQL